MDRRLKERLIGAAVLVAVGVWVIPWVLDGRQDAPEVPTDPLELPAPDDISPVRTETLRLGPGPAEPLAGTVAPARSMPEPVLEPEAGGAEVRPTPAAPEAEAPRAASAPPPPAAPPAAPAPAAAPAEPVAADAVWLVQLGAFGDAENAQRLADRVKGVGFAAEVSAFRSGGRAMHRVRVGPPATRARAEAAASALSAHGFVAQVVPVD